jgi:A/G-specific adenine glycosylase
MPTRLPRATEQPARRRKRGAPDPQLLARRLLGWYRPHARALPWRGSRDPYAIWISEVMLQQTQVATVRPYYARFLEAFPSVAELARAPLDRVLGLWSGLGYYARARNLWRAAGVAVAEHHGELPRTEAGLRELPGVGPYTAAAVAAIAFGERAFALDGNAMRVLARLFCVGARIDLPATRARLHRRGLDQVPGRRAGDFNQAVMELGATVCTPRRPRCDVCPLRTLCGARAASVAEALPRKARRAARPIVRVVCVCVTDGARVLMVKRPRGLLAGTWTLPQESEDVGEVGRGGEPPVTAARRAVAKAGVRAAAFEYRGAVRHVFTHRDVTAEVFRVEVATRAGSGGARSGGARSGGARSGGDSSDAARVWIAADALGSLGVSSFTRKTIALAGSFAKQDSAGIRP